MRGGRSHFSGSSGARSHFGTTVGGWKVQWGCAQLPQLQPSPCLGKGQRQELEGWQEGVQEVGQEGWQEGGPKWGQERAQEAALRQPPWVPDRTVPHPAAHLPLWLLRCPCCAPLLDPVGPAVPVPHSAAPLLQHWLASASLHPALHSMALAQDTGAGGAAVQQQGLAEDEVSLEQ